MRLDEELEVEAWRVSRFHQMGFDSNGIDLLQAWRADLHEVEHLMFRDGERTSCTPEQALLILQPVVDYLVLAERVEAKPWAIAR